MKNKSIYYLFLLLSLLAACESTNDSSKETSQVEETPRIISLSGFLTEVLYELGHFDKIVGRDVTSTYPAKTAKLPNLGHVGKLNAEAILALNPDMILVEQSQLKQSELFQQFENAGIKLVVVPTARQLDNSVKAARIIAKELKMEAGKIAHLAQQIEADSLELVSTLSRFTEQPKVLFIYARGAGHLMVGGGNTAAAAMIQKAGGQNAIQSFEGFKALTPESLIEAQPDVILMFESGLKSLDGKEGLAQIVGMDQTPAYKNNRIVVMDGHYLSAFGTRVGKAALELAKKIQIQRLSLNQQKHD